MDIWIDGIADETDDGHTKMNLEGITEKYIQSNYAASQ